MVPFVQKGKKLTDTQLRALFIKSRTPEVKGVDVEGVKQNGFFVLEKDFSITFQVKEDAPLMCPKCKKGKMHMIRELPRIRSPGGFSVGAFQSLLL